MKSKYIFLGLLAVAFSFQSCKKVSPIGIDNDQVVQTPYSLYVGNNFGWLINTNDGAKYRGIFPADGYAQRAIVSSKDNLLFIKKNLHLSSNQGLSFNVVYDSLSPHPWQEMIVDAPLQNRMYVTTVNGKGIARSEDNGLTWKTEADSFYNALLPGNYVITSFAAQNDGAVFGFSNSNLVLFSKVDAGAKWEPVTIEGTFPADDGNYFLGGDGASLFLTDYDGKYRSYKSEDNGRHWVAIARGAMGYKLKSYTCTKTPTGPILVGTEKTGVFREENRKFIASSGGMLANTSVYRLVVKRNVYKNGAVRYFVFAATNYGIYRSEDGGYNWDKVTGQEFTGDYRSMY